MTGELRSFYREGVFMKVVVALSGLSMLLAGSALAQQTAVEQNDKVESSENGAATPALGQPKTAQPAVLAPNTEIAVTPNDNLTSKTLKVGDTFQLSTMFDVMQNGYVVIPKNTPGQGRVSWRTGKGAFGKSAKMEIEFQWLDINGHRLPLTGKFRQEGQGNTGATVGTAVAVGVFSAFVTGKSANISHGTQLLARTAEPLNYIAPEGVAPVLNATVTSAPAAAIVTPSAAQ